MNPQNPISSTPRRRDDLLPNEREISYDHVHQFFERNKSWIVGLSIVTILTAVGIIAWRLQEDQVNRQATSRLAAVAHSIDSLQAVVHDFPGTDAALIAFIELADIYFQQGQWEPAMQCYQTIVDRYPSSPFVPSAFIGLAAIAEAEGKVKEAIQVYQSIASNFPHSFQVPQAQFTVARLQEENGQFLEARKSYEELLAKHPKSAWKNEAVARLQKLNLLLKIKPILHKT